MAYIEDELVRRTIADFDNVKSAIESRGVPVPYDTDTSEYGKLIMSIAQPENLPEAEGVSF